MSAVIHKTTRVGFLAVLGLSCVILAGHVGTSVPSEPFYNNDETRHVLTGVFFRDALVDLPLSNPREYAVDYYLQYPGLGLLIWPPLFYFVEGLFFLILGISMEVARLLTWLFSILSTVYVFRLAARSHGTATGFLAGLLFCVSPLFWQISPYVMLEIPTLAFALISSFHFVRFLEEEGRRDLFLAAGAATLAALTRYDAVYLLIVFAFGLAVRRKFGLLRRRDTIVAILVSILMVAPVYALSVIEIGWSNIYAKSAVERAGGRVFFSPENFSYYVLILDRTVGWPLVIFAILGVVSSLVRKRIGSLWVYLGMVLATYVTFAPVGKLHPRHSVYWVPGFAVLSVEGVAFLSHVVAPVLRGRSFRFACSGVVLIGTLVSSIVLSPRHYVRGYEQVAQYVLENTADSRFCLFDGGLNGNFIFQVRKNDPERRLWVLRSDKILYSVLVQPDHRYKELARTEEQVLERIVYYSPEYIVVEEPRAFFDLSGARLLRATLDKHPETFSLETSFRVESDRAAFNAIELRVYRNKSPAARSPEKIKLEILRLNTTLEHDFGTR